MASIYTRGNGFQVKWRALDGSQKARQCPDKTTAKRLKRTIEQHLSEGRDWTPPRPGGVPDLEVMFADVIRARSINASPGHVRNMTLAVGQLLTMLEEQLRRPARPSDLTRQSMIDLHLWLVRPHVTEHNPTTTKQHLAQCNPRTAAARVKGVLSLWKDLAGHEEHGDWVARPPNRMPELPSEEPPVLPAPTWAEMDGAILAAVPMAPAWYQEQLLTLARFTGLRRSQLMSLRWDWVDMDQATLWVHPSIGKSRQEKRGRRIPLSPHLVELMAGWGRREGFVIDTGTDARHVHRATIYRCWGLAGVRREVWGPVDGRRGQPVHAFRHGLATELLLAGAPEHLVQRYLGHQGATMTTKRYADGDALMLGPMREMVAQIPAIGTAATESVQAVDFANRGG